MRVFHRVIWLLGVCVCVSFACLWQKGRRMNESPGQPSFIFTDVLLGFFAVWG